MKTLFFSLFPKRTILQVFMLPISQTVKNVKEQERTEIIPYKAAFNFY